MTDIDRSFDLGGYAELIQGPDDRIILGRLTEDGQMSDSPFQMRVEGIDYPLWFRAVHLSAEGFGGWRVAWRTATVEHEFSTDDDSLALLEPGTTIYRSRTPGGTAWVSYDPVTPDEVRAGTASPRGQ